GTAKDAKRDSIVLPGAEEGSRQDVPVAAGFQDQMALQHWQPIRLRSERCPSGQPTNVECPGFAIQIKARAAGILPSSFRGKIEARRRQALPGLRTGLQCARESPCRPTAVRKRGAGRQVHCVAVVSLSDDDRMQIGEVIPIARWPDLY